MPSKTLVSSWTASIVSSSSSSSSSGTHPHHPPQISYPGKLAARLPVLKHLHGLWKGSSFSRKRHMQLASEPMLRRASSTINIQGGAMLASRLRLTPTPSPPISFSPSTPTTPTGPARNRSGVDTDKSAFATIELQAGSSFSRPFECLSPVVPLTGPVPSAERQAPPASCTQPDPDRVVSNPHSPPSSSSSSCMVSTTSGAAGAPISILDAATRLKDFQTLIAEMRTTLFHYDSERQDGSDAGNRDNDRDSDNDDDNDDDDNNVGEDGERERLLRLLEDVMRTVQYQAEKDAAGFGCPIAEIDGEVYSLGILYPVPTVPCWRQISSVPKLPPNNN